MRLNYLEVQGFKSFPDKTRLEFHDGITAVVGPNGSGKSNIADAVRWVLGEQSTRMLRGSKMEDVIFNGTQTRKAQGVASVTIAMDNRDRTLPFDQDEVTITRKIYRSGDGEYRINGTQVRLRDVHELFMDTGLGRDGYSIIGQGKAAEIVSAKSRERREIFEEAAGISKFRYRKNEAERRLALAEDNLVRLRDILGELESRVEPLRIQSEKAERFLALSKEKKTLEVSLWVHQISMSAKKLAKLEDNLLLAKEEFEAAEQEARQCEENYQALLLESQSLEMEIEAQRTAYQSLTEQAGQMDAQRMVLENDVKHREQAKSEAEGQILSGRRSREELGADLAAKNVQIEAASVRLEQEQAALTALQAQSGEKKECQAQLLARLEQLRVRRSGLFEAIDAAKLDATASATRISESEERLALLGKQDEVSQSALTKIEQETREVSALLEELAEKISSNQNAQKGYLLKLQARTDKKSQLEREVQELGQKAAEQLQRARVLEDMDRNLEGFGTSVKLILERARTGALPGVFGAVSSLISVDKTHATAIETALGGAMQNIVVKDEEIAKRAIGILRSAKAGRATFLPLSSVKGQALDVPGLEKEEGFLGIAQDLVQFDGKFSGVMRSLLGRIVVAEDLNAAVSIAKRHGYRFRIVTLDGQLVNAGGSMTGGYMVRSAGILGRQGEIEALKKKAQEILAQKQPKEAALAELTRETAALQASLKALEDERKTLWEDQVRCQSELSRLGHAADEARQAAQNAEKERAQLAKRILEYREQTAGSEGLLERLSAELQAVQDEIESEGNIRDQLQAEITSLLERTAAQNAVISASGREMDTLCAQREKIHQQLSLGEQQLAGLDEKIAALCAQNQEAAKQIQALTNEANSSRARAEQARQSAEQLMQKRNEKEQQGSAQRAREREISARRDELYRGYISAQEKKNSCEAERDQMVAKLWDEYEMSLSDAEQFGEPLQDIPSASRRLGELRQKIRSLGSVNVGAVEEYKEVKERYDGLSAQIGDVERSKRELTRLIGELTGQMREIFTRQFELIAKNFSSIFVELFGGGRAELSLSDTQDILESGIEISVQPPGKVIKNLSALSGGEQAFVAIAIFFAILRVNPAPFCLMDEIEAALDDVNVSRFASYLRNMKETQFITITHRRGTMEEADVLYGVTMQEDGVSKLLTLKVSEVEQKLGIGAGK